MDDFLLRALIGGVAVAAIAGPLGCFVVWRRMAYFGETVSHAALLGVVFGLMLGTAPTLGVALVCAMVAALLAVLERRKAFASDTLLGILAHGTLSLGLVGVAFMETVRVDLLVYLFGDILAISGDDLAWIGALAAAVGLALVLLWRPLLAATVHEELAQVEGVPVGRVRLAFMLLLALVVALAMKVVGILLVVALLMMPAAAARRWARTPEQLALLAALVGAISVAGGLWGSMSFDTPAGPSIVVAAFLLFVASVWWQLGAARSRRG